MNEHRRNRGRGGAVAAQSLQQPATRKTPVKRKIVVKTDRAVMPEAR